MDSRTQTKWPPHAVLLLSQAVARIGEHNWDAVAETLRTWLGPSLPHHLNLAPQTCSAQYAYIVATLAGERGSTRRSPQWVFRHLLALRTKELERELKLAWMEEQKLSQELERIESGAADDLLLSQPSSDQNRHAPSRRHDNASHKDAAAANQKIDSSTDREKTTRSHTKSNPAASAASLQDRTAPSSSPDASSKKRASSETSESKMQVDEKDLEESAAPAHDSQPRQKNAHAAATHSSSANASSQDSGSPSRKPPPYPRLNTQHTPQHNSHSRHATLHQTSEPIEQADTPRSIGTRSIVDSDLGDGESGAEFSDGGHEKKRARVEHKAWKRTAMVIWNRITDHRAGNAFLKSVKDKNYNDHIKQPMSLDLVKSRIRDGTTRTTAEFHRDVLHILANTIMFNSEDSEMYSMAQEMIEYTDMEMRNLLVYNRSSDDGF